jgi:hypothetical protein
MHVADRQPSRSLRTGKRCVHRGLQATPGSRSRPDSREWPGGQHGYLHPQVQPNPLEAEPGSPPPTPTSGCYVTSKSVWCCLAGPACRARQAADNPTLVSPLVKERAACRCRARRASAWRTMLLPESQAEKLLVVCPPGLPGRAAFHSFRARLMEQGRDNENPRGTCHH